VHCISGASADVPPIFATGINGRPNLPAQVIALLVNGCFARRLSLVAARPRVFTS
jgi:hypothetical protein